MARWRRRKAADHAASDGFERVVAEVERGKEALVSAVPSPRGVPGPLAEALLEFEQAIGRGREAMAAWRSPETELVWTRCAEALDESARRAERLRLRAPSLDYESLVTVLGELMEPLDVFEDAERNLGG